MLDLLKQAFTLLFARSFERVAQAVAFLLLARYMTPADFGTFGILTTAIALAAMLGSLGLRQSVAYRIGRKLMSPGEGLGTVLSLWPVLTIASATVVYFTCGRGVPGFSNAAVWFVVLFGVAGAMLVMLLQGINLGRGEVNAFSFTEALPRTLLGVFAILLAAAASVTFVTAMLAQVLSFLIAIPAAYWLASRGIDHIRPRLNALPSMVGYGIAFAGNLFLITLCQRLSMFVIEQISGPAAAGQFFAGVRVSEIFLEAATSFGLVLFSHTARMSNDDSVTGKNARIACWVFWSFTFAGLVVSTFAPQLLTLLLGAKYADAGHALRILALSLGPAAAAKVMYPTLAGQGRPLFGTPVIAASVLINVIAALALVPVYGVDGGAGALVIAQFVLYIGYAVVGRTKYQIPVRDFFVPRQQDIRAVSGAFNKMTLRAKKKDARTNSGSASCPPE